MNFITEQTLNSEVQRKSTAFVCRYLSDHLEARMQHEEERFSCAVKRLADPQGVGEKGPKHLAEYVNLGLLCRKKKNIRQNQTRRERPPTSSRASLMTTSTGDSVALSFL